MLAATTVARVEGASDFTAMVWIEDRTGAIARGSADSVTASGASVRLSDRAQLAEGDLVSLRLCLERNAPTVARWARIIWVRPAGNALECGLEWMVPLS
jgi:hypothetical protein